MKNSELYELRAGLASVKGLRGLKFAIMVAKNTKAVQAEIKVIEEQQQAARPVPSEEFLDYDRARVELGREYANKDDDGNVVVVDNKFVLDKRQKEFDEAWKALRESNQEVVDEYEARVEEFRTEFQALLDTDSDLVLSLISEGDLPQDMTGAQVQPLLLVITE